MTATPIRVAVSGAAGRMGRMLVSAVTGTDDMRVTGAVDHPDASGAGRQTPGELGRRRVDLGVPIVGHIAETADFDVLVDFSVATATLDKLEFCTANAKALVIGTTGFDEAGLKAIRRAAETVPIVMAPNMSVGVNVAFKLIEYAARALGDDVDVEVFEAHHRHKIDAPSGTAVRMGEILADALDRDIATDAVYGREGHHRRTRTPHHRLPQPAGRRHRRRTHGHLRRHRRAHRDHPPRRQPGEFRGRGCEGGPVRRRAENRDSTVWTRCWVCRGRPLRRPAPQL